MAIQFLSDSILIRGGNIATNSDCCCTPPCWPDPCIIPSCSNCAKCWDTTCLECRNLESMEVTISGVGDSEICPETSNVNDCCYGFDGCRCSEFNSTFIHDFTANGCRSSWDLDLLFQTGARFDTCGVSQSLRCAGLQNDKTVTIFTGVTSKQIDFVAGGLKYILIPCHTQSYGYVCQDYSILPGHFVLVWLTSAMSNFGMVFDFHSILYMYSFDNGVKNDVDCSDDQFYPVCSLTGGAATKVFSQRWRITQPFQTLVYYANCDSSQDNCSVGDATVTIGTPSTSLCSIEQDV